MSDVTFLSSETFWGMAMWTKKRRAPLSSSGLSRRRYRSDPAPVSGRGELLLIRLGNDHIRWKNADGRSSSLTNRTDAGTSVLAAGTAVFSAKDPDKAMAKSRGGAPKQGAVNKS